MGWILPLKKDVLIMRSVCLNIKDFTQVFNLNVIYLAILKQVFGELDKFDMK